MLGWRLLHEGALAGWPLGPLVPRPSGALDRDPIALALAAMATGLALVYLVAALCGARTRTRLALIAVGATLLVAVPTAAFMAMGVSTGRPYGQDGGVVQLPLAIDRILSGRLEQFVDEGFHRVTGVGVTDRAPPQHRDADIDLMMRKNPARLLGLSD